MLKLFNYLQIFINIHFKKCISLKKCVLFSNIFPGIAQKEEYKEKNNFLQGQYYWDEYIPLFIIFVSNCFIPL